MKQVLSVISAVIVMTGIAWAEGTDTPRIDQRQENQEKRIERGVDSGQLNAAEAARLNKQQENINKMENKAKADGVVTKKERARIGHAQDRTSRHIARQKHDRQGKRHR